MDSLTVAATLIRLGNIGKVAAVACMTWNMRSVPNDACLNAVISAVTCTSSPYNLWAAATTKLENATMLAAAS
ncbi:hypothetical protein B1991_14030 [Rhodanobacter lindaniclasticus]|uniref:Uncharacterized protein n=1 Tax=Rhodanobacter lindaniclasticus TaxID=75310 RepID=A0A4S3KCM1_9GAMM|nr:hypothetical protein B1991_14030 [Rhodanobacter lindaniclasticus]